MIKPGGGNSNSARMNCAAIFLFLLAGTLTPQQAARVKALSLKIMCMCGGCNEAAGKCNHMGGTFAGPCDTAKAELKELSDRVQRDQSDDLILQSFVQEYGPAVLLTPPTKGFDLWAWAMPAIAPLIGIAIVWMLVARWRKKETVAVAGAGAPNVSPELLERARAGMRGESDD